MAIHGTYGANTLHLTLWQSHLRRYPVKLPWRSWRSWRLNEEASTTKNAEDAKQLSQHYRRLTDCRAVITVPA
ncbi:MAG: hypothetical protein GX946_05700 [Oligosphaeraceae bacterium]|nr:hypothetical protein [Oligosphaeraceae bacterium]